jgi:hypothetical protein
LRLNLISRAPLIFCTTKNIVTQQTEESKRAGEILENLKLGCVNSKGSSDTGTGTDIDTDIIDIDNIPDTLTNAHIDFNDAVGVGSFKTAYNLKNQPDLSVVAIGLLEYLHLIC